MSKKLFEVKAYVFAGIAEFQPNSVVVDYSPGFKRKKKKVPILFGSVLR